MTKDGESGRQMRGVGGPLLCIGDLLSDVADDGGIDGERRQSPPPSSPIAASVDSLSPYDLQKLFQVTLATGYFATPNTGLYGITDGKFHTENYDLLIDSLSGTDHSWTSSTLKLCAALEKADRLILSANSSTSLLLEKIELLQSILKRGDAAVIKALEIVQAGKKAERL